MEGDTTNFYIYRKLEKMGVKLSVIARGMRDHSAQYVIKSPILLGGFYRHHIADILYHTDGRGVTPSVLLEKAVGEFSKLPGIGRKTAMRLVLHLLRQDWFIDYE